MTDSLVDRSCVRLDGRCDCWTIAECKHLKGVFNGVQRPDGVTDAAWQERLRSYDHWHAAISGYRDRFTTDEAKHYADAVARGARLAYWRSDRAGLPCNGGDPGGIGGAAYVGERRVIQGPLVACTKQALHATLRPPRWNGSRLWLVALFGEVAGDAEKFAALERLIIAECRE